MARLLIVVLTCLPLCNCASVAEHAVDFAIKHCWTHSGFSKSRDCQK